jgi:ribonuclease BN (tRNA processing enzyme)
VNIRVLGCHGSDQLVASNGRILSCRPCSFLVNDSVLIDAGTIGSRLTLDQQLKIRYILLSHLHFDHIKELPTLADNRSGTSAAPIALTSIAPVLDGLRTHIFNWHVYPDFFTLPSAGDPVFSMQALRLGEDSMLSDLRVIPVAVNHTVPTVGFVLDDGQSAVLYSGDTYETDELWCVAAGVPTLKAAFIEVSYPDDMASLAYQAKHLTPSLLVKELRKLGRPDLPVYAYHMKPRFRTRIKEEIRQLGIEQVTLLEEDQLITV